MNHYLLRIEPIGTITTHVPNKLPGPNTADHWLRMSPLGYVVGGTIGS